jgi:SWI/SNF-related matrix-associated actin-dependent regulator 1 of chromatin subfamily A
MPVKNERTLFPYQVEGAKWLASQKTCLLADEPRLGKAVQSIAACDLLGANLVLVVCRGVARANWVAEFAAWSKRGWVCKTVYGRSDVAGLDGSFLRPLVGPGVTPPGFELPPRALITNYENLEGVLRALPADGPPLFDVSIVDESHFVKNLEAKRSQLVFCKTLPTPLGTLKNGLPHFTRRHWSTTGTPTPNGLASELWTTLFTYGATALSFWEFAKRFCVVAETGYGTSIVGTRVGDAGLMSELHSIMRKKILRREAKDVAVQLPKMSFSTVEVEAGPVDLRSTTFWKYCIPVDRTAELAQIIETELGIMNGILGAGEDASFSGDVLETLKAQSKSVSTLRKYTALQKLEPACELIAQELEANAYQKVVIFAHHRDVIVGVQRMLHQFHPVTLYGGSNPVKVEQNVKNFQNPKHKCRVFIGQINAAGTSISLNAANHIFFLEESFVPDDNTQAAMRCGGVNQPLPIFVRSFCLANSYDYKLQGIIRQKTSENAKIYSGLSPAQLPSTQTPTFEDMI